MTDLRCVVSWHKYFVNRSPDGSGTYLECSRCGNVKDVPDGSAAAAF